MRRLWRWAVLVGAAALFGCQAPGGKVEPPPTVPSYSEVSQRFNARVARLNRVWSRVNLTLRSPKDGGGVGVDRAEGHLQVELPDRTALSVMKLGETYFYFGSDEAGYWWLDMSDKDRSVALYGQHEEATPELVGELGLPVHPRELLDLFGITPLPESGSGEEDAPGRVEWDRERGLLRVETAGLWGERVLWLDPVLMSPERVELRGPRGGVRAECEMGRSISVPVRGDARVPPKIASQYRVLMPASGATLVLELYGATNKEISPRAFDFAGLVDAYGIDEVMLLGAGGGARE